ncbi:hypothetical protein, partial [Parabacteroides distasonis]|uniref:hypothetical protein n=1 Tax=Parabacteroides distasonis TaxID=823 RepID=UPI00210D3D6F
MLDDEAIKFKVQPVTLYSYAVNGGVIDYSDVKSTSTIYNNGGAQALKDTLSVTHFRKRQNSETELY